MDPLFCDVMLCGGGPLGGWLGSSNLTAPEAMLRPSNLGKPGGTARGDQSQPGALISKYQTQYIRCIASSGLRIRPGWACQCPSRRMAFAKSSPSRKPRFSTSAIAHICLWSAPAPMSRAHMPYFSERVFRNLGARKQRDGDLARDDAIVLGVCLLEQEVEDAALLVGEIELREGTCRTAQVVVSFVTPVELWLLHCSPPTYLCLRHLLSCCLGGRQCCQHATDSWQLIS
jgi:hypothetical protein